ncbi:hypothetical protein SETIT_6G239600v2 [Setaria italica]|uniref:Uncharacterized protein n=1 Tax=Setaria italica TaxID=4555 RepID=A0A368RQ23_SETIT|nr:hypothetical protein SETIT_6G239600v2 [Setaria italica]
MVLVASRLLNADDDRRGKTETKPLCIMRAAEQLKVTRRGTDGEGLRKHGVRTWELHPPTKPNQTSPDKMGVNFMAIRLVSDDLVKTRERGRNAYRNNKSAAAERVPSNGQSYPSVPSAAFMAVTATQSGARLPANFKRQAASQLATARPTWTQLLPSAAAETIDGDVRKGRGALPD